ncbi:4Fe-4S cluster-binding domain-containing protein [Phenylobacterium aquaticum]|uniref:4Fe-4S cluster-binding domain-containing protein n=1 Tax=Phenylobacterium aquaticum TaxID=1763816 RepID=UPI001F5CDB67|nr:4Fe-4S cluster-binding domain-containing protein [Phenylobacterium aquaticum]MCI3132057.1 radical SAM protein [Phenylobacterium aquaticum]
MTALNLSRLHFPVTTLGPGRRIGVWVQGCSIRCPGCISADTWPSDRGGSTVEEVLQAIDAWADDADGLTVSGGEPFEQLEALEALLCGWRRRSAGDVLVFTGYAFAAVAEWIDARPGLIDAVIAGPYRRDVSQTLALRGSDNQTLHILTEAGRRFETYERPVGAGDLKLDVMFDADGGAWFAGIPARAISSA